MELTAADVDPAAVLAARRNLEPLGARVVAGDLFDALPRDLLGRIDVLAVNAPYVPTDEIAMMPPEARDHEARVALDGGGDGLDVHRRVAASAREWLAPGGHLLIETSRRQAPTTAALVTDGGLAARIVRDDELAATIVIGRALSAAATGRRRRVSRRAGRRCALRRAVADPARPRRFEDRLHLGIRRLPEVQVVHADGHEPGRRREAHDLVDLGHRRQLGEAVGRTDRHREHDGCRAELPRDEAGDPRGRPGGDPVVDDHRGATR